MPSKPNIILILADDMGYGDFGAFGDGSAATPALDRLVGEGVCLTQHYAGSPVCAPSRAAILTGRYPHRTGAIDTFEARGLDRLATREVTMADVFRRAGYATGLVGKWHLGALDARYHPNARGFDEFAGFCGGWQDYYDWRLDRNGDFKKADGRYLTDVLTEEAVGFVERNAGGPFFLHLAYNAPHFPFQAPEEEIAPFRETGRFTPAVATVYAMIRRMDAGIARVLDALERKGVARNTLVLFASDNGPQLRGKGENSTARYNCNFHGEKGNTYEGGIRVPAVVRWPDGLDAGRHSDEMTHFTDWLPTLAAAAGVEISPALSLDGRDVLPVLRGEAGQVETRRFWQWNRYEPVATCNAAMRDGDWKLVRPVIAEAMATDPEEGRRDRALKYEPETFTDIIRESFPAREVPPPPPAELYNIARDPGETRDLATEEPARAARMLTELETWFERVEAERRTIRD